MQPLHIVAMQPASQPAIQDTALVFHAADLARPLLLTSKGFEMPRSFPPLLPPSGGSRRQSLAHLLDEDIRRGRNRNSERTGVGHTSRPSLSSGAPKLGNPLGPITGGGITTPHPPLPIMRAPVALVLQP